jgi:hypothetical protein
VIIIIHGRKKKKKQINIQKRHGRVRYGSAHTLIARKIYSRTNIRLLDIIIVRIGVITITVAITVVGGTGWCARNECGAHDAQHCVAAARKIHQNAGRGSEK